MRVDRCRDMDELLSPIRIIVRMPELGCFLRYRISTSKRNFTSGKSHVYVYWRPTAAARRGFKMALFTEPWEHLCRRYMRSTECPSSCSLLLIYRPRKDERLRWPSWLTYSGRFTHISGQWSPVSRRSSVGQRKFACQRPTFYHCATQPTG